jgi:hypothetical protein
MKPPRAALQFGVMLLGLCMSATLTNACSSTAECECPLPEPIVKGEFTKLRLEFTGKPPAELRTLKLDRLLIEDQSIVVKYKVGEQEGTASFGVSRKYDL